MSSALFLSDDHKKNRKKWGEKNLSTFTEEENFACGDTKFFPLPRSKKLRQSVYNRSLKHCHRKKGQRTDPSFDRALPHR